jgi:FkbM family methyltransferase
MSALKALRAKVRSSFYRLKGSYAVTMGDQRFSCDPESWRYWRFVDSGKWEPHTLRIYRAVLRKTDAYLDIGAYIGPTALYASRLCGTVYCLEPDPRNYELLLKNIRLNRADNIRTRQVGLYHENTTLSLGNPAGLGTSGSSLLYSGETTAVSIPVVTFAEVLEHWHLSRVRLTKIDIEGAEFDLLPRIADDVAAASDAVYLSTHGPHFDKARRAHKMRQLEPFLARFPFIYDHNLRLIAPADVAKDEYADGYVEFLCARERVI